MGSHPRLAVASRVPPVLSKGRSRGLSLSRVLCRISDGLGFKGVLVTSWTNSRLLRSSFLGRRRRRGIRPKNAAGIQTHPGRVWETSRRGRSRRRSRSAGRTVRCARLPGLAALTHLQDGRPSRGKPGPQGESFRVRGERPS